MDDALRRSNRIRPSTCWTAHLGYIVSGMLHVAADDGAEADIGPGDADRIDPGHDAWVLGDERVVALEFESRAAETDTKG